MCSSSAVLCGSGCLHACQWQMADGQIANCYAEDVAESNQTAKFYPEGFSHHYWRPERLDEPVKLKKLARIFVGSMADVFGHWVPAEQIQAVLDVCREAKWHQFQFLTKNTARLKHFTFPNNCWVGASSPPDFMWGKPLDRGKQNAMLRRTLRDLARVEARTKWLSIEPLSWDITPILEQEIQPPFDWVVIGAASNGPVYYQPAPHHLRRLIGYLNDFGIPFFSKR